MQDYRGNFHVTSEAGQLDKTHLRFQWLLRVLASREADTKDVFPEDWRIQETLAIAYCTQTSQDFTALLSKAERTEAMDVKLVLATLQKTLEFESKLAKRFYIERREEERPAGAEDDDDNADSEGQKIVDTAEAIKLKYKKHLAEKKRAEKIMEKIGKKPTKTVVQVPNPRFYGAISGSFEPHLFLYINAEEEYGPHHFIIRHDSYSFSFFFDFPEN